MSRQFKIQDEHWGEYTLFVIHKYNDDTWESEWDIFRADPDLQPVGNLFTHVSYDAYQDALRNHSLPIIQELGLSPEACFAKLKEEQLVCAHRGTCSMHDPAACLGDQDPPACFEANLKEDDSGANTLVARVYELWRLGFYIVVAPTTD